LPAQSHWFSPGRHADRRPFLLARNRIIAGMRAWFAERDFLEADCAALAVSPGNEAHLHAFATELIQPDGSAERRYLHTSPEFAAKKLLAAGETRIFTLGHVWRNRERTPTHAPEFTMLEWYRAREDYEVIIADTLALVQLAAHAAVPLARPRGGSLRLAPLAHRQRCLQGPCRCRSAVHHPPGRHGGRGGAGPVVARGIRAGRVMVGHLQPHPV
jgi:elongation factor P--beta-lysine ligase